MTHELDKAVASTVVDEGVHQVVELWDEQGRPVAQSRQLGTLSS